MFYRARVEFRQDPLQLGRVKIRIPSLHGNTIPVSSLPWCHLLSRGGGYDSGDFVIPEVGAWLLVTKDGDDNTLWYSFGVVRGVGAPSQRGSFINTDDSVYDSQLIGQWTTDGTLETPTESKLDEPAVRVLDKSLKGATILVSDEEGSEKIDMIGRDGSTLRLFASRISETKGRENTRQSHDMNNPDSLDNYDKVGIVIKDAAGNIIRTVSDSSGNNVDVVGRGDDKVGGLNINLSSSSTTLFIDNGSNKAMIKITPTSISLSNGNASIDLSSSNIECNCSSFKVNASSIDLLASTVNVGGGTVNAGPTTNLGASISASGGTAKTVDTWTNDYDSKYGGDD